MTDAEPTEPGWYDDPDGRRRWWSGQHWGAYAPWGEQGTTPRPAAPPARPALDPSLTFDPTAAGRAARAQPASARAPIPQQPERARGASPSTDARQARDGRRMQVAYALVVTLGLLGAHRFYLGRVRSATVQMMLSFAAAAAAVVLFSDPAALVLAAVPIAAAGWWLLDLFRTARMVRQRNARETRADASGYDRGWPTA